jgi:L-lactate dehydrogenase complex protein LldE
VQAAWGFVRNYYTKLFDNSSLHNQVKDLGNRLFEFSEFMIKVLKVEDVGASLPGKATYHDSCAGLRECRIKTEPRQLLSKVKGLEITEMNDVETCCGFGGTFAVKFEAISVGMGEQKVENAMATDARYLISTDMSLPHAPRWLY